MGQLTPSDKGAGMAGWEPALTRSHKTKRSSRCVFASESDRTREADTLLKKNACTTAICLLGSYI